MNKIVTVVVTYNRKELLKKCINALLNQTITESDIIIIDNASTDDTKDYIAEERGNQRVKYFRLKKNTGGAGGFNAGLKKAIELQYEYFWLMDDDSIPREDALEMMLKADAQRMAAEGTGGDLF